MALRTIHLVDKVFDIELPVTFGVVFRTLTATDRAPLRNIVFRISAESATVPVARPCGYVKIKIRVHLSSSDVIPILHAADTPDILLDVEPFRRVGRFMIQENRYVLE